MTMEPVKIFVSGVLPDNQFVAVKAEHSALKTLDDAKTHIEDAFPFLKNVQMVFYYKGIIHQI